MEDALTHDKVIATPQLNAMRERMRRLSSPNLGQI